MGNDKKQMKIIDDLNAEIELMKERIETSKTTGIVVAIDVGVMGDFFGDDSKYSQTAGRKAVQLTIEVDGMDMPIKQTLMKSEFKGKFRSFLDRYEKFAIGMEVELVRSEEGFWRLDL